MMESRLNQSSLRRTTLEEYREGKKQEDEAIMQGLKQLLSLFSARRVSQVSAGKYIKLAGLYTIAAVFPVCAKYAMDFVTLCSPARNYLCGEIDTRCTGNSAHDLLNIYTMSPAYEGNINNNWCSFGMSSLTYISGCMALCTLSITLYSVNAWFRLARRPSVEQG